MNNGLKNLGDKLKTMQSNVSYFICKKEAYSKRNNLPYEKNIN